MEIRPLQRSERGALLDLLDGWPLPDGWNGRAYFARVMERDPTFRDGNVVVAVRSGELFACAWLFPRRIRVLGHPVPTAGLGGVFTRPDARRAGVASALVEALNLDARRQGFELSLLFTTRIPFFRKLGWRPWTCQRSLLRATGQGPPDPAFAARRRSIVADLALEDFDRSRDLEAVQAIHSAYSATRNGTVVRDDLDWQASLRPAGGPVEEFRVARRQGSLVAYLRAAVLQSTLTVTELARLDDGADGLAELVAEALSPRDDDPLAAGGAKSREIRSSALLPAFDDLLLTVGLEQRGLSAHPVEDASAMLRCLDAQGLARRLDVSLLPDEDRESFLARILPHDSLVFWPADRW